MKQCYPGAHIAGHFISVFRNYLSGWVVIHCDKDVRLEAFPFHIVELVEDFRCNFARLLSVSVTLVFILLQYFKVCDTRMFFVNKAVGLTKVTVLPPGRERSLSQTEPILVWPHGNGKCQNTEYNT